MTLVPAFKDYQHQLLSEMRFAPSSTYRTYTRDTLTVEPHRVAGMVITDAATGKTRLVYNQDQLYLFIILNAIDCLDYEGK